MENKNHVDIISVFYIRLLCDALRKTKSHNRDMLTNILHGYYMH